MTRHDIVSRIGSQYLTANIEEDEYSYAKDAGSKAALEAKAGHPVTHYKLDRRFVSNTDAGQVVVLVETKQNFVDGDADQLKAYLEEERALYCGEKVIAILANTNNDKIRVWKSAVDDDHLLPDETVLESMEYYVRLFTTSRQNDRELVMKNTYALNDQLHKLDIDEAKRSQFVGTCLLFVKDQSAMAAASRRKSPGSYRMCGLCRIPSRFGLVSALSWPACWTGAGTRQRRSSYCSGTSWTTKKSGP